MAAAFLALAVAACGSGSSQTSSTAALGTAVQQDCTTISDVLSDGPDPGVDPVGYAQAQVLPLRQLTISEATLHSAVLTLASAYQTFSTSTASTRAAAAQAVSKAENEVNKICPQAAP
jgi:flavin-binding protein dodecin